MTPRNVFDAISTYPGIKVDTICGVKARCKQYLVCSNKSKSDILDFDGAAHTYQKDKALSQTPQSVDAIAINKAEDLLILIEKKTWEHFLDHLSLSDKSEKKEAALAKLSSYDLRGKYKSTRDICQHITHKTDLFLTLPHVFVFVSELSDRDPMASIATMLSSLAYTSSNVDYAIQQPIVEGIKQKLTTIPCQRSRYLNCMELDHFINDPSAFR